MIVALASDHAGVELKTKIVATLGEMGLECVDLGPAETSSVDYPDFAHRLATTVEGEEADLGILICGSGIGMSMAANRHQGIRAALCHDAFTAEMARRHNNANVLCVGARVTGEDVAKQIATVFVQTPFEGGRHQRRVDKISLPPIQTSEDS